MITGRKIPTDTVIGIVILSFYVFALFVIVPNQIEVGIGIESSPRLYPQLLIIIIIFLSIYLIISSLWKRKSILKEPELKSPDIMARTNIRVLIMTFASIAYIWIAIEYLGFMLSSAALLIFLIRFYDYRKILVTIIIALLFPIIVYYIFEASLYIPLPTGRIFE